MKKEEEEKVCKDGQPPANSVVFKTLSFRFKFNLVAYDANHTRDIKNTPKQSRRARVRDAFYTTRGPGRLLHNNQ